MKVISLVPSITETLIEADVDVVGRTRYCIHPKERVAPIKIVGGTKNIDWEKVKTLKADLLVLDKEENPKAFADESPLPYLAIHVQDLQSLRGGLNYLGQQLKSPKLNEYATRVADLKPRSCPLESFVNWVTPQVLATPLEYVIWKDPVIAVSQKTYIGDVLKFLGHNLPLYEAKYPKLSDSFDKNVTYLFSSEPFPFLRNKEWIKSLGAPAATVDGELFSWFGIRSLRFLESLVK